MNAESISISQTSLAPGARKTLPAGKVANLKEGNVEDPVKAPDLAHVKALVADVQNNLSNTELHFSVNGPSSKIQVTVSEKSTGKIIREIPSSEMLKLAANMDEMTGIIFDKMG
jgi:flagellar protein FlaG